MVVLRLPRRSKTASAASTPSRAVAGGAAAQTPTRVSDETHLQYLLGLAQEAADAGEQKLLVTHLSQAVYVASTKRTSLTDLDLFRRIKRLIDTAGGLDG